MITVSLCMIVKNEEDTLAKCLASATGIADEIIIADTGSTDRTKDIAAEFTSLIFDFEWIDDFSAARNFSYEKASCDYILWLDADDIILPEDAVKFRKLKESLDPSTDAVMMRYNTAFDEQGRVTFSYYRERLTKRSSSLKWLEPVHEYLEVHGKRINSDICITHAKPSEKPAHRNIGIYEKLLTSGKDLSPRGMYYYARELHDHNRFADAADWFTRFLDSKQGWVEDNIAACRSLSTCYLALGMHEEALAALTFSFTYDTPRAETCCQLAYHFKDNDKITQAVFWFKLALSLERDPDSWAFHHEDSWGYIPAIELAVCYDMLGDTATASVYNEKAAEFKPDSNAVASNREYFKNKLAKEE